MRSKEKRRKNIFYDRWYLLGR